MGTTTKQAATGATVKAATTTTTTTTILPPMKIIGGLTMNVPDPDKFLNDTVAQDAVKTGIADAHTVPASSVALTVEKVARRLACCYAVAESQAIRLAENASPPACTCDCTSR